MSAFRVGQRIRLVWKRPTATSINPVGSEGVVTHCGPWAAGDETPIGGVTAPADYVICVGDEHSVVLGDQLEPILPEGAAPSTWDQCAWQPEHMRAPA